MLQQALRAADALICGPIIEIACVPASMSSPGARVFCPRSDGLIGRSKIG
jgi:hypothetical protein